MEGRRQEGGEGLGQAAALSEGTTEIYLMRPSWEGTSVRCTWPLADPK